MILNVSGRTDIVAFYTDWFINRYRSGFVDVRNPFNPKMVSRINFDNVDAILFCTKNPIPIVDFIEEINKPILFHVTLTPYHTDIEPNVPNKEKVIDAIKRISKIIGRENMVVRYDPVFISDKYDLDYHIKAFDKLCSLVGPYVKKILISFIDDCKNVRYNQGELKKKGFLDSELEAIGKNFSDSAKKNNLTVHTCFESRDLSEFGFTKDECLSHELAYKLTGKVFKEEWKARKGGKCHCVSMVDIGSYNTCNHMCKYCYANFDERQVLDNMKEHDPNSSLLIGHISSDDIIKERIK